MNINIPRMLNPALNPAAYLSAAGAVYAAAAMITNAVNHHGVINTSVILAAVTAVSALFMRNMVTPVKDPRDPSGNKLTTEPLLMKQLRESLQESQNKMPTVMPPSSQTFSSGTSQT